MTFSWQSTAWADGLTSQSSLSRSKILSTPSVRCRSASSQGGSLVPADLRVDHRAVALGREQRRAGQTRLEYERTVSGMKNAATVAHPSRAHPT